MNRSIENTNWADYLLAICASGSAAYSLGMSLGKSDLAMTLLVMVVTATIIGALVGQAVKGTKFYSWDGALAGVTCMALFTQTFRINSMLPDEGFPFSLIVGCTLTLLIVGGGLWAWRDGTLLFTSLPSLAMFGLVGTFDTYKPGTFLFFIYLVCTAVLYSRTHYRAMVIRAKESGVEEPHLLHRDAWRWMAGSGWAFASAGAIIVLSIIGGPLVRTTVRTIVPDPPLQGASRIQPPQPRNQTGANPTPSDVRVGTGPVELTDEEMFEVSKNAGMYLRISTYDNFTGAGWQLDRTSWNKPSFSVDERGPSSDLTGPTGGLMGYQPQGVPPLEPIANPVLNRIMIRRIEQPTAMLPSPGPVAEVDGTEMRVTWFPTGQAAIIPREGVLGQVSYSAVVVRSGRTDKPSIDPIKRLEEEELQVLLTTRLRERELRQVNSNGVNNAAVAPRVQEWVRETIQGATTDYDKAERLRARISQTIQYNTQAEAVPRGMNAVEHALFGKKEGYCDLFATTMTVAAREAGLTARYVTGFVLDTPEVTDDNYIVVRERMSHAWSEVYFEDVGWVPFDATMGAAVAPGGSRYDRETDPLAAFKTAQARQVYLGLGGLLALGGLVLLLRNVRFQAKDRRVMRDVASLERSHRRFVADLERFTKSTKKFSETTPEYLKGQRNALGEFFAPAAGIAQQFDNAFFAPMGIDAETKDRLDQQIKQLGREMSQHRKR